MNYLVIQTTYQQLQIGVFQDKKLLHGCSDDKIAASKKIILHIDSLLKKSGLSLNDLSFLAINQGPAPFTSLRVVISTINGLSFATGLPLVGVDGLAAFMQEYHDSNWPSTVALLNAFNNDVYFAIQSKDASLQTGCKNIKLFLQELKEIMPNQKIRFIGNGTELFKEQIKDFFGTKAYIPDPLPQLYYGNWNCCNLLFEFYTDTPIYKRMETDVLSFGKSSRRRYDTLSSVS